MFDSNDLVTLLTEAWAQGMPLAHNWSNNPWPGKAQSIHGWCATQSINWGAPQGYPVQEAQRAERAQPVPRIVAFQEPAGRRRIMFSLSPSENAAAFQAALSLATANGFNQLP